VPERPLQAFWIFSLPRSGSSVTAYAAGAALHAPVADEVFGPWDRTGPPYNYPPRQADLVKAHHTCGCKFTPEVVTLANEVLTQIAQESPERKLEEPASTRSPRVIIKHPHLRPAPTEFRAAFPSHRAVWLLRNPLTRLNSLFARGWTEHLRPNFELQHYSAFARHWLAQPRWRRLTFEQMRADPNWFYRRLLIGWGVWPARARVDRAVEYAASRYHASSAEIDPGATAAAPLSESRHALPREAVELYLQDEFIQKLLRRQGWPVQVEAYLGG